MLLSLVLAFTPPPVRAEPVEVLSFLRATKGSPSTSSGRTAKESALDADRAFAADAQTLGQWTAFAKWSTRDGIMFVPQPVNAHVWLKDRKEPPRAVAWQPGASHVACDGTWAINTGAWQRPDGSTGYFTTVWYKEKRGWRWLLDSGDALPAPRLLPARPVIRHAACGGQTNNGFGHATGGSGYGASGDATLRWHWHVAPDGARTLFADLWNGKTYDTIVDDRIAAE